MEKALLDLGGTVNEGVDFQIKENRSGIILEGFKLDGKEMKVEEVIRYKPWMHGNVNPGAGQVGIYRLSDRMGKKYYALIKDYRALEGDWRIWLVHLTETERELKDKLMMDSNYGLTLWGYTYDKGLEEIGLG